MRTIAITVAIIAIALVVLGFVLKAVGWLIAVGLVALVIAAIAGWVGVRRASQLGENDGPA